MSKICPRYEQEEETKQRRDKHLQRQNTGDAKRQGGRAAHPYQGGETVIINKFKP